MRFLLIFLLLPLLAYAEPCDESRMGMIGDEWYQRCLEMRDPNRHTTEKDDRVQAQCEAEWEKWFGGSCHPYTHDYPTLPVDNSIFEDVLKT